MCIIFRNHSEDCGKEKFVYWVISLNKSVIMLVHSNREIHPSVPSYTNVTVHTLHQTRSILSSRTTYCPRHSVTLPEELFEIRKCLEIFFPGKCEKNAKVNMKTYELFIYAYIRNAGKSFCKNVHTVGYQWILFKNMSASHQKNIHIFIRTAAISYF